MWAVTLNIQNTLYKPCSITSTWIPTHETWSKRWTGESMHRPLRYKRTRTRNSVRFTHRGKARRVNSGCMSPKSRTWPARNTVCWVALIVVGPLSHVICNLMKLWDKTSLHSWVRMRSLHCCKILLHQMLVPKSVNTLKDCLTLVLWWLVVVRLLLRAQTMAQKQLQSKTEN